MSIAEKLKPLFAPRMVSARLPYLGASIVLLLLGVAVRHSGWQWLFWPLAGIAFHASVRPSIASWALLTGTYLCFSIAQLITVFNDYRADALWAVPVMGAVLAFIGLGFYRCRPREIMEEGAKLPPLLGARALPVKEKSVEEERSAS